MPLSTLPNRITKITDFMCIHTASTVSFHAWRSRPTCSELFHWCFASDVICVTDVYQPPSPVPACVQMTSAPTFRWWRHLQTIVQQLIHVSLGPKTYSCCLHVAVCTAYTVFVLCFIHFKLQTDFLWPTLDVEKTSSAINRRVWTEDYLCCRRTVVNCQQSLIFGAMFRSKGRGLYHVINIKKQATDHVTNLKASCYDIISFSRDKKKFRMLDK